MVTWTLPVVVDGGGGGGGGRDRGEAGGGAAVVLGTARVIAASVSHSLSLSPARAVTATTDSEASDGRPHRNVL